MNDGHASERELAELVRRVQGTEPPDIRRDLITLHSEGPLADGSTVPLLALRLRRRASGLLVPAQVGEPTPVDLMQVYVTHREVFEYSVDQPTFEEMLTQVSARETLEYVAAILSRIELGTETEIRAFERDFAQQLFKDPYRERLFNLLTVERRRLFSAQVLLILAKMGAAFSPADPPPDRTVSADAFLTLMMLAIAEGLGREGGPPQQLWGGLDERLVREIVANQRFYQESDPVAQIARNHRIWNELAASKGVAGTASTLRELYTEAVGIALDDVQAVAFALWTGIEERGGLLPADWLRTSAISPSVQAACLKLLSADISTLAVALTDESREHGVAWSLSAFSRWPIVRLSDEEMLVLSPRLLLQRVFGGLVYFDIEHSLRQREAKLYGAIRDAYGEMVEAYALELLAMLAPSGPGGRLFTEDELKKARPGGGPGRIADAVIDYGDEWVVIEINSRRLMAATTAGASVESLDRDIEFGIVEEAEQVADTVQFLRQHAEVLTGHREGPMKRFRPVILNTEQFPINPITLVGARDGLLSRGLLNDADVEPLEVVDLEGLELVIAIGEQGGPSFAELLAEKADGSLRLMGLKEHLILNRGAGLTRPRFIEQLWDVAIEAMTKRLGLAE